MKPNHRLSFTFRPSALITLSLSCSSSLMAADVYWAGPTGGSWNDVANWSTVSNANTPNPALVPGTGDLVYFSTSTQPGGRTVNLTTNQSVKGVTWTFDQTTGLLTVVIPEPGQMTLLLMGGGATLLHRRKK